MKVKAIKAYRIEELQPSVKNSIINKYHNEHYWDWDLYSGERNKSFQNICELLGLQLFNYDGGYVVGVEAFNADEIKLDDEEVDYALELKKQKLTIGLI